MNFMMNKQLEKSKIAINMHTSSSIVEEKQIIKYLYSKTPLLFSLYENRLIHFEFLKEIFAELLENKEVLRYNFQTKIFSFYNTNSNLYSLKVGFLKRSKIILITTTIILLLRSFPYQLFFNENKYFFRLYLKILIKAARSPLSLILLVCNKIARKIRIQSYIIQRRIKFFLSMWYKNLFLSYLQYRNFSQNVILTPQNYITLFKTLEIRELLVLYKRFTMLWFSLFLHEQILINRLSIRLKLKTTIISNTN